jgi:hypothetical protein
MAKLNNSISHKLKGYATNGAMTDQFQRDLSKDIRVRIEELNLKKGEACSVVFSEAPDSSLRVTRPDVKYFPVSVIRD